jgi:uncharacterized membrane protein
MSVHHPVVERYMARLEQAIGALDPGDRREILQEIRNHIAEAMTAGRPLEGILGSLGPADALGRAYAIELLLHPPGRPRQGVVQRWFTIVGLVVVLSLPTLIVVSTLGSIGISFVAAGVASFALGVIELAGVLPSLHVSGLPPGVPILAGALLLILGMMSLAALRLYVRLITGTVRAAFLSARSAGPSRESAWSVL